MCTAPVRCCLPRLLGGLCCLERARLTLIDRNRVCVVFVCWLQLDSVRLNVILGALGSFRLLSIHSVRYPGPRRL
jgi:hypothetical protein